MADTAIWEVILHVDGPITVRRRVLTTQQKSFRVPEAGLGPARRYQNWWKTPEVQAVLRSGKKYREMAAELAIGMSVLAWIISESRQAGLGPPRRYRKRRRGTR
jgi:hypothetical protein